MELSKYLITENNTIMEALEQLNETGTKVLFVVQEGRLCASVVDGDIRRAILGNTPLTSSIKSIANYKPIYVKIGDEKRGARILKEMRVPAIPVVDDNMVIIQIYSGDEYYNVAGISDGKINIPIVIMAGGLGTRLYPYTKILPKPLIPIGNTPIVERIIQTFQDLGCREFYMIVNHKKNMLKAYFNDSDKNYNIQFCDEITPLGTGGGIKLVEDKIKSTFILTNCDILILDNVKKMVAYHQEHCNQVTMVCSLKNYEIPYGIVNCTEEGKIESFEEKPKMSFLTNTGYYILEPQVFKYVGDCENISMPDIISRMKDDNLRIGVYPIEEDRWLDMGQLDSMEGMERRLKEMGID